MPQSAITSTPWWVWPCAGDAEAVAVGVRARGRGTCGRGRGSRGGRRSGCGAHGAGGLRLGDVELVAALGSGLPATVASQRDRLHRAGGDRADVPVRDDCAVGLVQEVDRDAAVRGGAAVEVERRLGRAVEEHAALSDAGGERAGRGGARDAKRLACRREATPSALTSWTRPLRAPWGTTASTCVASATVAGADTSSALPLPPVNTTCVTLASCDPSTRIELPGRAVASDAQPVRQVTVDETGGGVGAPTAEPPNAVPPVDAAAGATATAFSTAMTMTVRRFSSIHSPVDGPTGLADGLAASCRYQGVIPGFAPEPALPAQWFPRSGSPGG